MTRYWRRRAERERARANRFIRRHRWCWGKPAPPGDARFTLYYAEDKYVSVAVDLGPGMTSWEIAQKLIQALNEASP